MSDLLKNTLKTISKTFKGNNKQTKRSSKKTAPSSVKKPKNTSNKNKATVAKIKNQDKLKAANKKANQNKGLKAVSSVMNPSKNKLNKTTSLPSQQTMKQKGKAAKKKQQEDSAKKKAAAEARAKEMDYKAAQKNNDLLDKGDLFKLQRNDPLYEKIPHLDPVIRRQASNAVNYGAVPKDLEKATAVVDDVYISGKYLNFDSEAAALDYQERFKKWQKENTYTIKKYNSVTKKFEKQQALKLNATAPPMGVDVNGNKPPADWEDSWKYYLKFNKEIEFQTDMSVKQTQDMTADYTDISDKTSNSFFDVVRDSNKAYLDAADKYEGEIGRSQKASLEYFKTLFKGLYNYSTRYIWNPIRTGNWGILLNNTLTNLGETMDYVAIGFKAIASARTPKMYGAKHGFDDTKEAWVYSGGKHLQEKMMKLGARNAFTSGEAPYATAEEAYEEMVLPWVKGDSAKWDKKRKKTKVYSDDSTYEGETTLKEEFIKMYNEWYFKGGKETQKGDISEALAEAYTTHKHVDVDTGFLPTDIIGEMALDPGVLLGGFASMGAKASVESIVKTGVKSGLDTVARNGDEAVKVLDVSKELSRRYTKNLGKDLLTKNYKAVEKDIDTITEALIKDGVISKESKTVFSAAMNHSLKEAQDTMNWKIVRSLHYVDNAIDTIDRAALKGVFFGPYVTFKMPKLIRRAVRKTATYQRGSIRYAVKKRQAMARIQDEVGFYSPSTVEKAFNVAGKEDLAEEGTVITDEVVKEFLSQAEQDKLLFGNVLKAIKRGDVTKANLQESLDKFASEVLKDPNATLDSLKMKIEELSQKFTGRNDDIGGYLKIYQQIFEDADKLEQHIEIRAMFKCLRDLEKICKKDEVSTVEYLEVLDSYKDNLSEDIYNLLHKAAIDEKASMAKLDWLEAHRAKLEKQRRANEAVIQRVRKVMEIDGVAKEYIKEALADDTEKIKYWKKVLAKAEKKGVSEALLNSIKATIAEHSLHQLKYSRLSDTEEIVAMSEELLRDPKLDSELRKKVSETITDLRQELSEGYGNDSLYSKLNGTLKEVIEKYGDDMSPELKEAIEPRWVEEPLVKHITLEDVKDKNYKAKKKEASKPLFRVDDTEVAPIRQDYKSKAEWNKVRKAWVKSRQAELEDYYTDYSEFSNMRSSVAKNVTRHEARLAQLFETTLIRLKKAFPVVNSEQHSMLIGYEEQVRKILGQPQKPHKEHVEAWTIGHKVYVGLHRLPFAYIPFESDFQTIEEALDAATRGYDTGTVIGATPVAAATHEWGHHVEKFINTPIRIIIPSKKYKTKTLKELGKESLQVKYDKAVQDYLDWRLSDVTDPEVERSISKYAATTEHEFIAECFTQLLLEEKPSKLALEFAKHIRNIIGVLKEIQAEGLKIARFPKNWGVWDQIGTVTEQALSGVKKNVVKKGHWENGRTMKEFAEMLDDESGLVQQIKGLTEDTTDYSDWRVAYTDGFNAIKDTIDNKYADSPLSKSYVSSVPYTKDPVFLASGFNKIGSSEAIHFRDTSPFITGLPLNAVRDDIVSLKKNIDGVIYGSKAFADAEDALKEDAKYILELFETIEKVEADPKLHLDKQGTSTIALKMSLLKLQQRLMFTKLTTKLDRDARQLLDDVTDVLRSLNNMYLSNTVTDVTEYVRWQKDMAVFTQEYMENPSVQQFFDAVDDVQHSLGDLVSEAKKYADFYDIYDDPAIDKLIGALKEGNEVIVDELVVDVMERTGITDKQEILSLVNDKQNDMCFKIINELMFLSDEARSYEAYKRFQDALTPQEGRAITSEEKWALIDSLFQFNKGNPEVFIAGGEKGLDKIIDRAQVWLDAVYGNTRASTDGFTQEVLDFYGRMWRESKYAEEVKQPEVQEALKKWVSGGHLNPMDDVKKQMLMSVVKDPEGIKYYNKLAETQHVLFVDLETQGMNKLTDEITAVAIKEWVPLDENASLMEILETWEKSDKEQSFHTYLPDEELKEKISNEILELCYKYDKTVAPTRAARLEKYLEDFGAEKAGKVVTEKEMLSQVMYALDNIYLDKAEKKFVGKNPLFVTHNNNGFDMNFLRVRASKTGEFPQHIKHLDELAKTEVSSLRRVKNANGDPMILKENREYMREVLYNYFKEISAFKNDLRIVHPKRIKQSIENINDIGGLWLRDGILNKKKPYTSRFTKKMFAAHPEFKEFMQKAAYNAENNKYDDAYEALMKGYNDVMSAQRVYKNSITPDIFQASVRELNFYERGGRLFSEAEKDGIWQALVDNDARTIEQYNEKLRQRYLKENATFQTVKYNDNIGRYQLSRNKVPFTYDKQDIDNVLKLQIREFKRTPYAEATVPTAATKKFFSSIDTRNCFEWLSSQRLTLSDMRNMQNFAKHIDTIVSKLLKNTSVFQGCKADFDAVIMYCKKYASQLGTVEDFSYLKYLRTPDTLAESYAMAQKLWDLFTCRGQYNEVKRYLNAEYDEVPDRIKSNVLVRRMLGDKMDLETVVGKKALAILNDKDYAYHSQIMRNIPRKDYYDLDVDWFDNVQEFDALMNDFKEQAVNLDNFAVRLEESSKFADDTDFAIKVGMARCMDVVEDIKKIPREEQLTFRGEVRKAVKEMCKTQTTQVMEFITKSKDNLLSHLLFNNQLLIVPLKGDELYTSQLKILQDMLEDGVDHVVYTTFKDQLCIGLSQDSWLMIKNDSKYATEATEMRFRGEDKIYTRPKYKRITINTDFFTNKEIVQKLKKVEDSLDYLTAGATRGSTGVLHTLSRHMKVLKELPDEFTSKMITEETTCDARLWHSANFDMSLLGEYDYRWKLGNEQDLILSYMTAYKEVVSKVKAERLYLDSFFNTEYLSLKSMFAGEKVKDIVKAMDEAGMVAVVYKEGKTSSGFQVQRVKLSDELSYKLALENEAIVVPYDVYVNMMEVLNDSTVSNNFLKIWSKFLAVTKSGQIMFTGTWVRNYIDGVVKASGDVGSFTKTMKYQLVAMKLIHDYSKISRFIDKNRGLSYQTAGEAHRFWDAVQAGTHTKLTLEQYEFLEGWFNTSISGGQSRVYKSILKMRKNAGYSNKLLTDSAEGFDMIASQAQKFSELPLETVESFIKDMSPSVFSYYGFTKEDFKKVFTGEATLDEVQRFKYNELCEDILQANRDKAMTAKQRFDSTVDRAMSLFLLPMSKAEEYIRLGEYLALADEGYNSAQIFRKITESQFNYDLKSERAKILEMVIPFYTFLFENAVYWCKQISENPRMIRYLEDVWGPITWDDADESEEDYTANKSMSGLLNSGRIPLGESGLNININPSFLDAMNWVYQFPDAVLTNMAGPLQLMMRGSMRQLGADSWELWSDSNFWSNKDSTFTSLMKQIPIVGSVYSRAKYLADQQPWLRLAEDSPSGVKYLTYISSLFGVDYSITDDSFEEFKQRLEKQGKWWDNNTQSVRDLSEKNYEGLNSPSLLWSERALHNLALGKVWDNNQRKYVRFADFQYGGLNKDFDFTNPDDWEEYSKLRERMFGEKYDANVGKWVSAKDYSGDIYLNNPNLTWDERVHYMQTIRNMYWDANQGSFVRQRMLTQGGLNSKDLSWNEIQIYNYTIFGKEWDKSQHKFVKTTEPVVEFQLQGLYTEVIGHVKPKKAIGDRLADKLGINVYATKDGKPKQNKIKSKYIITGDPAKDAEVYKRLLQDFSYIATNYGKNYKSGYSGGYYHKARSYTPKRTSRPKGGSSLGSLKNLNTGIKSGGKVYGTAYSSGKNQAGLRMATSNYTAYDKYYHYNYEYNYVYQYKNAVTGVANYPQTKLGIDRYMSLRNDAMNQKLLNYNRYSLSQVSNRYQMGIKQRLNDIKLTQYRH